jgi:CubicO group peptidase (beta-lactamase class C family)
VLRPTLVLSFVLAVAFAAHLPAQSLPRVQSSVEGFSAARLSRLTAYLQAEVDSGRTAGVVAMIVRNGRVVYEQAVGMADREARRAMTPRTLFRIASQTKAVTSVAAMMLVEEGKLGLNDPVSRYIPAYSRTTVATVVDSAGMKIARVVPARRQITIRDLLTHLTGVSYGTDSLVRERYAAAELGPNAGAGWYFTDKREPVCVSMERLATLPFVAQPGERWVYGYSSDILGCVVERASGLAFDKFVRTRITEPLGMADTRFCVPAADRERLAAVYSLGPKGLERAPEGPRGQGDYVDGPCASFSGGAGLVSTAGDYIRFLTMLAAGGALGGTSILSPTTVSLMTHDHVGDLYGGPESGFGLGFEVFADPPRAGRYGSPGAYGWGGAYFTSYWVDPQQKLAVVMMTQLAPATGSLLQDRFRALVYQAIVKD